MTKFYNISTDNTLGGDNASNIAVSSQKAIREYVNGSLTAYGTCATGGNNATKTVTIADTNWRLRIGCVIGVTFSNTNTANSPKLDVNSTGAKNIKVSQSSPYGYNDPHYGGLGSSTVFYMYDGTYWVWLGSGEVFLSDATCYTAASSNTKSAYCSKYVLRAGTYIDVEFRNANSYSGPIKLNINNTGDIPLYINGAASNSSNSTIPAGRYVVYYDGYSYYMFNDGSVNVQGKGFGSEDISHLDAAYTHSQVSSGNPHNVSWAELQNKPELLQGTQGVQGTQGPQGTKGLQGFYGIQGLQGLQGKQGTKGNKGDQGTQGIQGVQGTKGLQGLQGLQGTKGDKGDQGTQGIQGVQGTRGLQGLQGLQGTKGTKGDQGTQGIQGIQGVQGTRGLQGLQGTKGTKGDQGTQGIQGVQGTKGLQGLQGLQGMKGDKGDQGTQGIQGVQGAQGIQGVQGTKGLQGLQGLQGTKGNKGDQGTQGIQGIQGVQGTKGLQGLQGLQGTKGNKGDQGTQGIQGVQGAKGLQGLQGLQGTKGNKGDQGTQGIQGVQGTKGLQGLQGTRGLQGLQGTKGDKGNQGTQGIQGIQGLQGTKGNKGDQGTQGIQGVQGTKGLQGLQGLQGTKGTKGDQGTQGIQGIQGLQGTRGLQGLQGTKGNKGDQGTQGIQGVQGVQGTKGLQGLQGTRGLQGLQGTRGLQGLQGIKGIQGLQGRVGPTVQSDYTQMDSTQLDYIKNAPLVRIYRSVSLTNPTTGNYMRMSVTDSTLTSATSYTDGMVICLKVPAVNTIGTGTVLKINNLDYKPIVYAVNSDIEDRYPVGSVIWAVYNSSQTATYMVNGTQTTSTGCWQIMDYNSDTIAYRLRLDEEKRPVSKKTYRYRILFSSPDNSTWIPSNNSTSTNATSVRIPNNEPINPFGRIVYFNDIGPINAASGTYASPYCLWDQYILELGYSFNNTGTVLNLTAKQPVYIKCDPQTDGSAVIDGDNPYVQSLPASCDNKIYIHLGQAYSTTQVELQYSHPVYYHDGRGIRLWTGRAVDVEMPITYSQLKQKRDNGKLVPGQTYRITDYVTQITPYDCSCAVTMGGIVEAYSSNILEIARVSPDYKQYDILVTAVDQYHLSEDCRMAKHGNETYFDEYDLPSWKIKYSLDNDKVTYGWARKGYDVTLSFDNNQTLSGYMYKYSEIPFTASSTDYYVYIFVDTDYKIRTLFSLNGTVNASDNMIYTTDNFSTTNTIPVVSATAVEGKGVVYYMEDMNGNKLPYDYINIQFKLFAFDEVDIHYIPSEVESLDEFLDTIEYSEANNMYGRLMSMYLSFANGLDITFADFSDNFDWYYTFDQYIPGTDTHINVFFRCYDVVMDSVNAKLFSYYGSGNNTFILPCNVFQFTENYPGVVNGEYSEYGFIFGAKTYFISGVRFGVSSIGNVFYYSEMDSSSTDSLLGDSKMGYIGSVDGSWIGNVFVNCFEIKADWLLSGCVFSYGQNVRCDTFPQLVLYNSTNIIIDGIDNMQSYIFDSNNIKGSNIKRIKVYDSDDLNIGQSSTIYAISSRDLTVGAGSFIGASNTNGVSVGNYSSVGECNYSYEVSVGDFTDSLALQSCHRVSIGDRCKNIYMYGLTGESISYVNVGNGCKNVYFGDSDKYMRVYNCSVMDGCSWVLLHNQDVDYTDNVLRNVTIFNTPFVQNFDYYRVYEKGYSKIPLNSVQPIQAGLNSNGIVVYGNLFDFISYSYPKLGELSLTTTGYSVTVSSSDNSSICIYYTIDGTEPSSFNYQGSNVEYDGNPFYPYNSMTISVDAGVTYKFIGYKPDDRTMVTPVLTYIMV